MPDIAEAPSQADSFAGRPACREQFTAFWPQMLGDQPVDVAYRRLYYYLHKVVDRAIGRILDALQASGMADDTIVVFTSDHGDLLGAHGLVIVGRKSGDTGGGGCWPRRCHRSIRSSLW